ncbi:uncharacterized protein PG986_002590 [Apiospora aurea]|uniref:AMP-dependent synthetase/ligase domain-containing protein n=1 Tax=Apiospora aurea TaxID=335848 RepID=A0ABR1QPF2_9PEZI
MTSLAQEWSHDPARFPERTVMDPRADSYILFTSGSTGVPKGIKLHQQGMMNCAAYTSQAYGPGQVNFLQQTSIGFDLAFGQIYNALTNGGTLVAASVEGRGDPDALSRLIHDEKVEYTLATPSEYSLLLNYASEVLKRCAGWRCAHTAGEVLPNRLIEGMRDLKLPRLTLTDAYGPAEAFIVTNRDITVHAGAAPSFSNADDDTDKPKKSNTTKADSTNIGRVLPNTSVYIGDETDGSNPLPVGVPGELCIAGGGVANGYLDAALSATKFVPNPHATAAVHYYRKRH